ncbi:MAG TPA: hypothetical protein VI522_01110, partial [Gammaproteobacteria bacterium]|nr:hypothetical protein [Gammaproteobacteria bacterium]
ASCIDRAQSLLEEGFKVGTGMAANQIVYTRYDDMIGCFWHLEGYDDDKMLDDCRQYRNRLFPTKDIKFIGFSSAHADFKDTNTEDYKGE